MLVSSSCDGLGDLALGEPPDASTASDPLDRGVISIDSEPFEVELGVRLYEIIEQSAAGAKHRIGWKLEGTEPYGCDDTSITCVRLRITLPVDVALGTRACADPGPLPRTTLELLYNFGTPYHYYKAASGDPCTFEVVENGTKFFSIANLDAHVTDGSGSYQLTGSLRARIW